MDGTQSSFIIDEDVLWMSRCCCASVAAAVAAARVCVRVRGGAFGWGSQTPEKSVLVISALAAVNSH